MKSRIALLLGLCLLVPGCRQDAKNAEIELLKAQLSEAKARLVDSGSQEPVKRLVHVVWFKLKQDSGDRDLETLVQELEKLHGIEVVQDLVIGRFQDLDDPRAMSDLDIVMYMEFESEHDYRTYQSHPIHVKLKTDIGDLIGAPPVTYDFWTL